MRKIPPVEVAKKEMQHAGEVWREARAQMDRAVDNMREAETRQRAAEGAWIAARLIASGIKPERVRRLAARCAQGDGYQPGDHKYAAIRLDGKAFVHYYARELRYGRLYDPAYTEVAFPGEILAAWWTANKGSS